MNLKKLLRRSAARKYNYQQDGLWTLHNADFIKESDFARAYDAGVSTGSWGESQIQWRVRVALWAASIGAELPGDFVECGVNLGGLAKSVVTYLPWRKLNKKFFLFDTFEGFHRPYLTDSEASRKLHAEYGQDVYAKAASNFEGVDHIHLVKGAVPDTLSQVDIGEVAYLSIDMNCVYPEVEAFRHFKPRLSKGAVVLLDDYGWTGHEEQKQAFDQLSKEFDLPLLPLPTGQALMINR
ncbi:MAG: TylF/MycF/NovP-related O-methyltransferase [Nitratireductor sp.]